MATAFDIANDVDIRTGMAVGLAANHFPSQRAINAETRATASNLIFKLPQHVSGRRRQTAEALPRRQRRAYGRDTAAVDVYREAFSVVRQRQTQPEQQTPIGGGLASGDQRPPLVNPLAGSQPEWAAGVDTGGLEVGPGL